MATRLELTTKGLDKAIAGVAGLGPALRPELRATVERQTILLQRYIVEQKLSGQVLHVRTGTGWRSITYRIVETAERIIGIVGTNLGYMIAHEFGMTIHIPEIRPRTAKALHFMVGGKSVFAMRARAHDIHLPERSFLRSSLRERAEAFREAIRETIARVFARFGQ